jgi:hypothetical protein
MMRASAFLMIGCLIFLSAFAGKVKTSSRVVKENCCHKMAKQTPCSSTQNNDSGRGMCYTMLSCASCGFLKVDPVLVNAVPPVLIKVQVTPYHMGDLSDYSISNWNPPKV